MTSGYQTEFQSGESAQYSILIENNEDRTVSYTMIAQLERVESGSVGKVEEIDRFSLELAADKTTIGDHEVTPTLHDDDLRLSHLVYISDLSENLNR